MDSINRKFQVLAKNDPPEIFLGFKNLNQLPVKERRFFEQVNFKNFFWEPYLFSMNDNFMASMNIEIPCSTFPQTFVECEDCYIFAHSPARVSLGISNDPRNFGKVFAYYDDGHGLDPEGMTFLFNSIDDWVEFAISHPITEAAPLEPRTKL